MEMLNAPNLFPHCQYSIFPVNQFGCMLMSHSTVSKCCLIGIKYHGTIHFCSLMQKCMLYLPLHVMFTNVLWYLNSRVVRSFLSMNLTLLYLVAFFFFFSLVLVFTCRKRIWGAWQLVWQQVFLQRNSISLSYISRDYILQLWMNTDGIVINMVVGGEVVTLKSIEESSSLVIAEMPINVSFHLSVFLPNMSWRLFPWRNKRVI